MVLSFIALLGLLPVGGTLIYLYFGCYLGPFRKHKRIQERNELADTPEINDPVLLGVEKGRIPFWLKGVMYRVGPGRFNIQQNNGATYAIRHAFDGLPFMHRFEINGMQQTIMYNSRMLAKSLEDKIKTNTHKGLVFFGHVPGQSFLQWLRDFGVRINNMVLSKEPLHGGSPSGQSVGVTATPNYPMPASIGRKNNENILVSKTDANVIQKLHAETLEPECIFDYSAFNARIKGQLSAAHHQEDPLTREVFNFTLTTGPVPRLVVFSIADSGKTTILADFTTHYDSEQALRAPYIHSFWLTESYVIIPESPMVLKDNGVNMLMHGSFLSSITWDTNAPTYCHVIERKPRMPGRGLVASIPVRPGFYTFHVANAFETFNSRGETLLHLDAACFSNGDIMHQLHTFGMPHAKGPTGSHPSQSSFNGIAHPPRHQDTFGDFMRYTLCLESSTCLTVKTFAKNIEFPRFNQAYSTQQANRFVFGCQLSPATEKRDQSVMLVKLDLFKETVCRYGEEGYSCSEPVFIPNPAGFRRGEDDGVLLALMNGPNCCYFVIVDAVDMREMARIKIGQFSAITFHGSYVDHEFESINVN